MPGQEDVFGSTEGGIAARHPAVAEEMFLVAPNEAGDQNRLRAAIVPVACWRVDDVRFDFDSSFTRPELALELTHLARLVKAHPGCPLTVFGHADPVGNDEYNKALSGRRATVVYAVMIANTRPGPAASLWLKVASEEGWGNNQWSAMRQFTGAPEGTGIQALTQMYLQKLAGPDLRLSPADFLARGKDAQGKGDYQGCSEFNPLVLFSQADEDRFAQDTSKKARNDANSVNRRVLALLFRPRTEVTPGKWPCPSVGQGTAGCRKRFWSDGEARRSTHLPGDPRSFVETQDTFACRFYQRLAGISPCEKPRRLLTFQYCLQLTEHLPWSPDAEIRFIAEDGLQVTKFKVSDGDLSGDTRAFTVRTIIEGVRYRAEVEDDPTLLELFPLTELFKIEDPDDPFSVVPLLAPNEFGDEPDFPSGDGVGDVDDGSAILDGGPPPRS